MTESEHLKILQKGVKAWNEWRASKQKFSPKIPTADFHHAELDGVNFSYMSFPSGKFRDADLFDANLENTYIYHADFRASRLNRANFVDAKLHQVDFRRATAQGTIFRRTELVEVNFSETSLLGADFRGASIDNVTFIGASFAKAKFENAKIGYNTFASVDLSEVKGLDLVEHFGPSSIGIDTLFLSKGKIPEKFLRGVGMPDEVIEHTLPSIRIGTPIQWNSCFISYSTKNEKFAQRLHSRMRQAGLRVWFAPEDMKGGDYFF